MKTMKTKQVLAEPRLEKHLHGHNSYVTSLCFDPKSKQLVSSSHDRTIMLWNLKDRFRVFKFFGHTDIVSDVCFSPLGNLIISSSFDGTIRFWEPRIGGTSSEFRAHIKAVRSVDISQDGKNLLTASNDKSVKMWSVQRKVFLSTFTGHNNWVQSVRFSHDGKTFVTASDDRTLKLFDRRIHKCVHSFSEDKVPQKAIIHPSDNYIASALRKGTVKIYDLKMFKQLQIHNCHEKDVTDIDFHPNGNYLFSASNDGTMKILDLLEGRSLYTLNGNTGPLTSVSSSHDGNYFVFGSTNGQILLWKADFDYVSSQEDSDETNELIGESCSSQKEKMHRYDKKLEQNKKVKADCLKNTIDLSNEEDFGDGFLNLSSRMDAVLHVINKMSLQLAAQDERIKKLENLKK